jgi:hypothetical protein
MLPFRVHVCFLYIRTYVQDPLYTGSTPKKLGFEPFLSSFQPFSYSTRQNVTGQRGFQVKMHELLCTFDGMKVREDRIFTCLYAGPKGSTSAA